MSPRGRPPAGQAARVGKAGRASCLAPRWEGFLLPPPSRKGLRLPSCGKGKDSPAEPAASLVLRLFTCCWGWALAGGTALLLPPAAQADQGTRQGDPGHSLRLSRRRHLALEAGGQ